MKIFLSILFSAIFLSSFAQFTVKIEKQYLELINKSEDIMLHRQNFHNAEMVCDSLFSTENKDCAAEFLIELAKSYTISKDYPMAVYTIIRQRTAFPNESVETKACAILRDAGFALNLTKGQIDSIISWTNKEEFLDFQAAWHKQISISFLLSEKKLDDAIQHSYLLFSTRYPSQNSFYLQEINMLINYNIPIRKRNGILNLKVKKKDDWINAMDHDLKMVFLRKEIKYYKKVKAKRQARISLKNYKKQHLNVGQYVYYAWNSIWN